MADPSRGLIIFCVRESSGVHVYIVLRLNIALKSISSIGQHCSNTYFIFLKVIESYNKAIQHTVTDQMLPILNISSLFLDTMLLQKTKD